MIVIDEAERWDCDQCEEEEEEVPNGTACPHNLPTQKMVMILPGCCKESTERRTPMAAVHKSEDESDWQKYYEGLKVMVGDQRLTVRWEVPFTEHGDRRYTQTDSYKLFMKDTVRFCPYCGSELPKIVLNPDPPQPTANYDDCGHCECGWPRSQGQCGCYPIASLFKTEPHYEIPLEVLMASLPSNPNLEVKQVSEGCFLVGLSEKFKNELRSR